tara:strand:+ start:1332 stop:1466 length:135 start_codon:yes stop_codon:yes gene_type:complete
MYFFLGFAWGVKKKEKYYVVYVLKKYQFLVFFYAQTAVWIQKMA